MADRAFVIGAYLEGDVNVERFRQTALNLHYDVGEVRDCARARRVLAERTRTRANGERDLVLFYVDRDLRKVREHLVAFKHPARRVIVYAAVERASTDVAVEYCREELAHDFLISDDYTRPERLAEHITLLHRGEPLYASIDLKLSLGLTGDIPVFVATPYDYANTAVMFNAVDPALAAAGFKAIWACRIYRESSVSTEVAKHIRRSQLLIANISRRAGAPDNPNVYYEAGQATALGIPVIFVRPTLEKDLAVPADIGERRRIEYDNPIDLALRLYHGLRR